MRLPQSYWNMYSKLRNHNQCGILQSNHQFKSASTSMYFWFLISHKRWADCITVPRPFTQHSLLPTCGKKLPINLHMLLFVKKHQISWRRMRNFRKSQPVFEITRQHCVDKFKCSISRHLHVIWTFIRSTFPGFPSFILVLLTRKLQNKRPV